MHVLGVGLVIELITLFFTLDFFFIFLVFLILPLQSVLLTCAYFTLVGLLVGIKLCEGFLTSISFLIFIDIHF